MTARITFDENGHIVLDDPDTNACPTDPADLTQCDSCQ